MIGFTAEWESGEITPDGCEIHDAKWFLPSEFPNLPMGGSISMMLIQDYVRRYNEGLLF
jgi:NAD+ diphosphatase